MIQIIKDVFNKHALRLVTDRGLGVVHTVDGLVDNLLGALSDSADLRRLIVLPAHPLIVTGASAVLARYVPGVSRPSFALVAVLHYF